jgi:hypothetical protein
MAGTTWSRVAVPPYSSRAYGSPAAGDWAIGSSLDGNTSGIGVMHLVNGTWKKVPFPAGLVPKNQPGFPGFISAESPASVWATLEYGAVAGGPSTHVTDLLLHWNGRTWSKVNAGSRVGLGPVFPDGHGGFFTGVDSPTLTRPVILYDYRGGHWTSVPLPAKPGYVLRGIGPTLIPGTTSLIGWGDVYNLKTKAYEDAILHDGP